MTSSALTSWQTTRRAHIDNLVELHDLACRLTTDSHVEKILCALVLRLAAEFQGFAVDLHDEAIKEVIRRAGIDDPEVSMLLAQSMTAGRSLERANANPATLAVDFGRLGCRFWFDLDERFQASKEWKTSLEALNACRNAVAHGRGLMLADLARRGWELDLPNTRRWLNSLDELASAMDYLVETTVDRVFGPSIEKE
jgi:hypothetical protein